MFPILLLCLLSGVLVGIATGLIPGFHPNTVFTLVAMSVFLFQGLGNEALLVFAVSLAVANTFVDFIPSILFGAPEEDSILSILPGHRMLLNGRGYEAVFLTVVGGLGSMILVVTGLPFLFFILPIVYGAIRPIIHIVLIAVIIWMLLFEKGKRKKALLVLVMSGLFGIIALNTNSQTLLFPSLTGMFGMSALVVSMYSRVNIPKQTHNVNIKCDWFKGSVAGWLAGVFSALLPGVGSSQAGVIASQILRADIKEFMIALGGINTSNIFFTFMCLYLIGKTRSGAAWFISQVFGEISMRLMFLVIISSIAASLLSAAATLYIAKRISIRMANINYSRLTFMVMVFLVLMITLQTGIVGLITMICGLFIGLVTISFGVRRAYMMGFLLIPTIVYFSGLSGYMFI